MDTSEILKKVRRLEIKTKGLSNHIFSGEYHSHFKGRGMSFSEVREYTAGDDVKTIDWNVTARFNTPFVKVFEEERELIVMLLVDVSNSSLFGLHQRQKRECMSEIAAVLAFSASTNNDKVGVIFFSDKVEKFIPPKKGRSHILRIIREMIAFEPVKGNKTNVGASLEMLNKVMKKRSIAFLLSDFVSTDYTKQLQIAARKHDLVGIQVYDTADRELPDTGLLNVLDAETGNMIWIDSKNKNMRNNYTATFDRHSRLCIDGFRKTGAALIRVRTDQDYVKSLQTFFLNR